MGTDREPRPGPIDRVVQQREKCKMCVVIEPGTIRTILLILHHVMI